MSIIQKKVALFVSTTTDMGGVGATATCSNKTDLGRAMKSISMPQSHDEHDDTVMGQEDHSFAVGLGEWSIEAELLATFDTGKTGVNVEALVDQLIQISRDGGNFSVAIRPFTYPEVRTSTNPEYYGLAVMSERTILDGAVGDLLMNPIVIKGSGTLTRTVSTASSTENFTP